MPMADATADVVYADQVLEHMSGIDAARQFTAEALRSLRPGGVFFVVVPDYLKERTFFWDVDYTHNFVTTERRVKQLFNDGGFDILHVERSIGVATGVARDALAAAALLVNIPGVDALSRVHRHGRLRLQGPQEPVRDADLRRAQAARHDPPGSARLGASGALTRLILACPAAADRRPAPALRRHAAGRPRRPSAVVGAARPARPGRDDLALGAAAARQRHRHHAPDAARIFLVSSFVGSFLPAGVGADAARAYAARTATRRSAARRWPRWPSTACSAWSLAVMGALGVVALRAGDPDAQVPWWRSSIAAPVVACVGRRSGPTTGSVAALRHLARLHAGRAAAAGSPTPSRATAAARHAGVPSWPGRSRSSCCASCRRTAGPGPRARPCRSATTCCSCRWPADAAAARSRSAASACRRASSSGCCGRSGCPMRRRSPCRR